MSVVGVSERDSAVRTSLKAGSRTRRTHPRLPAERVAELVRAAAAGDERAWNGLVDQFAGLIWAVARAHRLREADASEVFQTTWLRLVEHVGELRNPAAVGGWLANTARRECLRVLRHGQRQVLSGEDADDYVSADMAPGDALLLSERDDALRQGFARLRASDQALLRVLMTDPRPSYDEIAAGLNMAIGSIGPTRQRALTRLRNELDTAGTLNLMID